MKIVNLQTDVLIIGGGTAGCYAAITLGREKDIRVLMIEKANIKRSGCLAAGVNALNAYITKGHDPQFYVDYATKDAEGIVREDLLLTMSERLNHVTEDMETRGLVILKDENGEYVTRGPRNLKINGENIKPILASAAVEQDNLTVINHVNITSLKTTGESENKRVSGAYGFDVNEEVYYDIDAKAVLCATGGAAGLYRPNNPGFSRHKMWYSPFNTGAGYAFGLLAGAEMTTFEMRFVALRCKDTIAPTGTIAQGVHAKQTNARGEVYEQKYGLTTSKRLYGTVQENLAGRGPCYLDTKGISAETQEDLYKAYLNMAPGQTLKWLESGEGPSLQGVEIEGTEPYIVGGHTASGYWVDTGRMTTLTGLFAAGDVAGGCPQKYVTGALAEGEIAAESIVSYINNRHPEFTEAAGPAEAILEYQQHRNNPGSLMQVEQLEEAMQKIMDEYAGGITARYQYHEAGLKQADRNIDQLIKLANELPAADMRELLKVYELKERLIVCKAVIAHMEARKETRWHGFGVNTDYPDTEECWMKYVNSTWENGQIKIRFRELVKGENRYEHSI